LYAIKVSCLPSPFKSKKITGKSGFGLLPKFFFVLMTTDGEEEEDKEESSEVKISHCFTNEIPLRVKVVNDPPEREQRMSARRKRERTRTSLVLSTGVDFDFLLPILSLLTLTLRKMPKGKFRSWIFRVLNPTWLPMHLSLSWIELLTH